MAGKKWTAEHRRNFIAAMKTRKARTTSRVSTSAETPATRRATITELLAIINGKLDQLINTL